MLVFFAFLDEDTERSDFVGKFWVILGVSDLEV